MPTHQIIFDLPKEAEELNTAMKGIDYYCVLIDFSNKLREKLKYGELSKSERETYEQVKDLFYSLCQERDISL